MLEILQDNNEGNHSYSKLHVRCVQGTRMCLGHLLH